MSLPVRCAKQFLSCLSIVLIPLISACGGGGGGGGDKNPGLGHTAILISGTAAAGAPVVGYVSVRDSSNNPQPVRSGIPIAANGNYAVDVAGLTPPYALLATGSVGGKSVQLYSAATSADQGKTINITPFTDLMIRNIAASAVDAYIASGAYAGLTATQLDDQRVALTNQLAPALQAMGLSGSIDLLRASFNADSTGLDKFMDVVKVSTTATTATITNILDAANTLIIDTTTGASTGSLGTGGLAPSGTPFDGIKQTVDAMTTLFATSLPSASNPDLIALFADSFMDDGIGRDAFLADLTTQQDAIGVKISHLVLDSVDTNAGVALIHFVPLFTSGVTSPSSPAGVKSFWMKLVGGVWKIDGNQRLAYVLVRSVADKIACNPANPACTTATTLSTGLYLDVSDDAGKGIATALVKGPGLPAKGVALTAQAGRTSLLISTANPLCGTGCTQEHVWRMSDADIANVLPNSVYGVELYDASAHLLASYSEVIAAAPVLNTALSGLAFPALGNMVNLVGKSSITLTPSWSVPSGLRPGRVAVWVQASSDSQVVDSDLTTQTAASGTTSMVVTAPAAGTWIGGEYSFYAWDAYARRYSVAYR